MPSSVQVLLDAVAALAEQRRQPNALGAGDAIGAVVQLGRALEHLSPTQTDRGRAGDDRRHVVINALGVSIDRAAGAWPTEKGRMTDLAGSAADLIARTVTRRGAASARAQDQHAAGRLALARAAHDCVAAALRFAPYSSLPTLITVLRLSDLAAQLGKVDPPPAAAWAWLERDVAADPEPGLPAALALPEATARLVHSVRRELADGTLSVHALVAATAAARTLTADAWPGKASSKGPASQGWRVLQTALMHLDDGSRIHRGSASRVVEHATALRVLARHKDLQAGEEVDLADTMTGARHALNQLPALADLVGLAVLRGAESGHLFARARSLPRTDDRAAEQISDRVVMVRPSDVSTVIFAARATSRLSASLAVELDRADHGIGYQPHPMLIEALRAQVTPAVNVRDIRWARGLTHRIDATRQPVPPTPCPSLSAVAR